MSNSLLDFVMALVRDPDVAAQYAADPAQAIAAAGLVGVSSADVDQLIPVVSESVAAVGSAASSGPVADANVWASGAATAAFDAFGIDDSVPVSVADLHDLDIPAIVDTAPEVVTQVGGIDDVFAPQDQLVSPVIDEVPIVDPVFEADVPVWAAPDAPVDPAHPDLDLFD
ncbi:Rv0340 family IniB-related protein [Mycobacterium sp. C31M]